MPTLKVYGGWNGFGPGVREDAAYIELCLRITACLIVFNSALSWIEPRWRPGGERSRGAYYIDKLINNKNKVTLALKFKITFKKMVKSLNFNDL